MLRRALLASALSAPVIARAQGFTAGRPVSIVLPYSPSAGQEVTSRILTEGFAESFGGGTYVNDHRPGAGTTVAARYVARARPDGTTLLLATNVTFTMAQYAYRNPGFDPDADFHHISLLSEALYFVAAQPKWQSVEHLVAEAKRRPGELVYTSWGVGSVAHLLGVDFCRRNTIDMLHMPFNGTPPALIEIIAGRADMIFTTMAAALPHVQGGRLRAIATPSPQRIPGYPDLPTMQELGYEDFVMLPWYSLSAPPGLPPALLEKLEDSVKRSFATAAAAAKLAENGLVPAGRGRADMLARIVEDRRRNRELMRLAGIQPE
ncbi:tripartite tricarboxylate transporter substrate binding protein [Siccirubricoccus sp. KC 17139]|uniref:Tripartite tricarboxylate transporter substrate binding protein n=1 Tax=Siccirubricoccus soli TaxID=2899147 RepID=A0ABT1DAS9_9PROT|nr:tripartite tricarboxylate transporter substrate binding protein [Siccirubricoccus soli]MCO6419045.1 tripartite tricarboxylate transporter substrate binding protein [Siccirubricoccus soli]MCP2685180.1 tripartite tricarboxylate transporter substrate binding protein [Siccirubricoccus soli]